MFSSFFKHSKKNKPTDDESRAQIDDGAFFNLSADKLKAIIALLNDAEPFFARAGYRMEQLEVEFGTTPKLTPRFIQVELIGKQQKEKLFAELDNQPLLKFILISLDKSSRMQSLFHESELHYYGMEIDISGSPTVRSIFRRRNKL